MKKKILAVFLMLYTILFKFDSVFAATNDSILKREFVPNVWSFHYRNGAVWTYGQLNIKYVNDKLGYCIEPDSAVNTDVYSSYNDWSVSTLSDYVKKRMELYSYYGYQYEGHQTIKYYMATQELIWLYCGDESIKWTVSDSSSSEEINVQAEKNEIIRLVNKHNLLPSFSNLSYKCNVGDTLKLEDTNSVLSNYKISTSASYKVKNNELSVFVPNKETIKLDFSQKGKSHESTIVYAASIRSQRVATFGPPDNIQSATLTIIPDKIKVNINKKDSQTNENVTKEGNVIKIKNIETKKYVNIDDTEEFEIGENGALSLYLEDGIYQIEEIKACEGYSIQKKKKIFEVNKRIQLENYSYNVDFYNDRVYGQIKLVKVDEKDEFLEGCVFEIYDENMNLVDTITTTKQEYDDSILLPLGKYYIKEVKTIEGYEIDNKIYNLELKYENDRTPIVEKVFKVTNKKIRCDVVFISVDDNDKPIDNVSIGVYDSDDNLIYEGKTDKNGEVSIDNVTYGDYYVKETKVPNGYKLNEKKVSFTINDDCCLASLKLNNNKVNMPTTSTKNADILSLIILIVNVGILKIVKKTN